MQLNAAKYRHALNKKSVLEFLMQPPTCKTLPLRIQLAQLRQAAAESVGINHQGQTDKLSDQIKTWSESMTPEQRKRRFTMEEIERLAGLVGKLGKGAAHHHIAQSLRAIGFDSRRDWTAAGRNKRYWIWSSEL